MPNIWRIVQNLVFSKSEGIVFSKFISVEPLTLMDLFWFYNLIPVQAPDKHTCITWAL